MKLRCFDFNEYLEKVIFLPSLYIQKNKKNMDMTNIHYAGSRSFNNCIIYMRCSYC